MRHQQPDSYAAISFDEWLLVKGVLDETVLTEQDRAVWHNAYLEDMERIKRHRERQP